MTDLVHGEGDFPGFGKNAEERTVYPDGSVGRGNKFRRPKSAKPAKGRK